MKVFLLSLSSNLAKRRIISRFSPLLFLMLLSFTFSLTSIAADGDYKPNKGQFGVDVKKEGFTWNITLTNTLGSTADVRITVKNTTNGKQVNDYTVSPQKSQPCHYLNIPEGYSPAFFVEWKFTPFQKK